MDVHIFIRDEIVLVPVAQAQRQAGMGGGGVVAGVVEDEPTLQEQSFDISCSGCSARY